MVSSMAGLKICVCQQCGKEYQCRAYKGLCRDCKAKLKEYKYQIKKIEDDIADRLDGFTKWDKRYNTALVEISKQVDIVKHQDILDQIACVKYLFGSVPEVIFAFTLLMNGLYFIPQYKVSKYKIDFAIPDEKIFFEVDGDVYHKNLQKEAERDFIIEYHTKHEWKMYHIPDDVAKSIKKSNYYINKIMNRR